MPTIIELHDSVVQGCIATGDDVVVRLSPASLHRASGRPGFDPGDVFTLDLDLGFSEAVIEIPFGDVPIQLADGSLTSGDATFRNHIPFPFDGNGPVVAELIDCYGRVDRIASRSLTIQPASKETYLDGFPGTDT